MFKRFLLASAALVLWSAPGFAADLPMKAPEYVPPPVYDWTGFYGTEWGFAPGWSARIEYDHIFFDSRPVLISGTVNLTNTSSGSNVDLVRAGVNYRFNWGAPLVAKY